MSETELIEKLDRLETMLAGLSAPPVPLEVQLWDLAAVSKYLRRHTEVVRESMACLPDFPKAVRLPGRGARSHALYYASEIIAWAKNYREKR